MIRAEKVREQMKELERYTTPIQEKVLQTIEFYIGVASRENSYSVVISVEKLFDAAGEFIWAITDRRLFMEEIFKILNSLGYESTVTYTDDSQCFAVISW